MEGRREGRTISTVVSLKYGYSVDIDLKGTDQKKIEIKIYYFYSTAVLHCTK
jgi:hypothetical protein